MSAEAQLRVAGKTVAVYVVRPDVPPELSPRPYLHPVRTLGGTVVTEVLPADHPHHLGASVAVQDVDGTNVWGGRTYVRDTGYTWRDDHGRIVHRGFDVRADDRLVQRLLWCDPAGGALLDERRTITVRSAPGERGAWVLDFEYALTAPASRDITLGSPVTNGRPLGAGYGGFFWRAATVANPPDVFTASAAGEEAVNSSTEPWVALVTPRYSLVFTGLADGDHWFVRAAGYPGVCAALAFEKPRTVPAGATLNRRHAVVVADGALDREAAAQLATVCQPS